MTRVVIIGAAGRMGKKLIANVMAADDMELAGALEFEGCPFNGMDAGTVAGRGESGIKISAELEPLVKNADAVIDFSTGDVIRNTEIAAAEGCSIVIGTTALENKDKARLKEIASNGAGIVFAPNMSIGVNLLFHLSRKVTEILGDDYDIEIVEMHHNQKKDAPSGTAVRLAEVITDVKGLSYEKDVMHGRQGITGERTKDEIGMHAVRGGDVVGDHTVIFATGGERVELTHKASSRDTFAKGSLRAVRFLTEAGPGLYDMQDVLGLNS
jgi:4-hydroxy-tetrahydrodipicolinate reductase